MAKSDKPKHAFYMYIRPDKPKSCILYKVRQAKACILHVYKVRQAKVCIPHVYKVRQAKVCILYEVRQAKVSNKNIIILMNTLNILFNPLFLKRGGGLLQSPPHTHTHALLFFLLTFLHLTLFCLGGGDF